MKDRPGLRSDKVPADPARFKKKRQIGKKIGVPVLRISIEVVENVWKELVVDGSGPSVGYTLLGVNDHVLLTVAEFKPSDEWVVGYRFVDRIGVPAGLLAVLESGG